MLEQPVAKRMRDRSEERLVEFARVLRRLGIGLGHGVLRSSSNIRPLRQIVILLSIGSAASEASRISAARSTSSSEIVNGGAIRMQFAAPAGAAADEVDRESASVALTG